MNTKPMEASTVELVKLCLLGLRSPSFDTRKAAEIQLLRIAAHVDDLLGQIEEKTNETR